MVPQEPIGATRKDIFMSLLSKAAMLSAPFFPLKASAAPHQQCSMGLTFSSSSSSSSDMHMHCPFYWFPCAFCFPCAFRMCLFPCVLLPCVLVSMCVASVCVCCLVRCFRMCLFPRVFLRVRLSQVPVPDGPCGAPERLPATGRLEHAAGQPRPAPPRRFARHGRRPLRLCLSLRIPTAATVKPCCGRPAEPQHPGLRAPGPGSISPSSRRLRSAAANWHLITAAARRCSRVGSVARLHERPRHVL